MTALRSTLGIQIFSSQGCQWHISVRNNLTINTTNHTWIWSIISGKKSGIFFQDFFVFWVVCFSTRGHVMTAVRSTLGMEISTSQGCHWQTSVRNHLTIITTDHTWVSRRIPRRHGAKIIFLLPETYSYFLFWVTCSPCLFSVLFTY